MLCSSVNLQNIYTIVETIPVYSRTSYRVANMDAHVFRQKDGPSHKTEIKLIIISPYLNFLSANISQHM